MRMLVYDWTYSNILEEKKMKTIKCESCGAELDKIMQTCPNCGAPLKAGRNLVKCRTCGEYVAKDAKKCPNCGTKHPNKSHHTAYAICSVIVVITVILIAVVAFSGGSGSGEGPTQGGGTSSTDKQTPEYVTVDATGLWDAYVKNEVNADNLYKSKLVAVTGVVTNIGKDAITGAPCVSLESGSDFGLYPIQCFFPKNGNDTEQIAALSDGDTVTIYGRCTGKSVFYVQLSDCSLSTE
nr:MAG TPA: hypothetical protein [Caudoviricetes sp.]